jgi:peroxin-19
MEATPGDLEGLAATTGKAIEKESDEAVKPKDPTSYAGAKVAVATEDVPDPDEDDLDDLDGQ